MLYSFHIRKRKTKIKEMEAISQKENQSIDEGTEKKPEPILLRPAGPTASFSPIPSSLSHLLLPTKSQWLRMPFPGKPQPSIILFGGANLVAFLLRSRFILKHLHFPKFQANTPAPPASFHQILMAASSSSSSSSLKCKRNYDVFLSFRGTDVRKKFLGHLYTTLNQNGIFTYIDNEEMRKGEPISQALMKAIEESRVAIIIFSENYASSTWCLEEVAKIMECKAQKDLIVLPVFYQVEPREVRESYGGAMAKHEIKFGKDSDKVKRWKKALFDAGSLSGWDLNDGDEVKLIKRIVKEISRQLDRRPLHVAKHPVGIHPRVQKLESMLNLESDDVLMIGLWGLGGIGKTTLGKALYNANFRQFEGSCFLPNVREASKDPKDLVSLQEKLLSEILQRQRLVVSSVDRGINLMQDRLCCKKVLLILDDVNDIEQLNALAGECEWFGEGSRIIITTRDKHLLTSHGIDEDHIYEVEPLEYCEALELLNKHAFERNNKAIIRGDLVDRALHYANGLPLALKVLGFFLCGRRESEWESTLHKLAKGPDKTINDALKLSYDGLEEYAKEIFLDIACFFKGQSKEYIMKILHSCNFDTTIGVQVLVERSLVIEEKETLHMHNLIQLMAMDIVKQEYPHDPGRRSRLWLFDDFRNVLSGHMVTNALESIVLKLPKPEKINIRPHALTNMRRLKKLIMNNVHNSFQGPIYLPNKLRWFEWPECRPCVSESSSRPKKLAQLDLHESNIQALREQFEDSKKLESNNFSECPSLVYMPIFFNGTSNLEEFDFHGFENLKESPRHPIFFEGTSNLEGVRKPKRISTIRLTIPSIRLRSLLMRNHGTMGPQNLIDEESWYYGPSKPEMIPKTSNT